MLSAADMHQKALSNNLYFLSRDIYFLNQEISWLLFKTKGFPGKYLHQLIFAIVL
jgi:hypothetical protein